MRFRALACDYDGTLASDDRLVPGAAVALGEARDAGLRLVLVTGRSFFDLTRVCDRLDLFDVVVAENGAVVYVPGAGMIREEGPPPPARLLAELDRRGIYYEAGRVVVGVGRRHEAQVREALAASGTDLAMAINRAALMLLPAGISKETGVRRALEHLGLSFHDVLAIGDAENDLALFAACGWSACPSDAVEMVRARVDFVLPGRDGQAVAAAIAGPIREGRLAGEPSAQRRIPLGWAAQTGGAVTIPARDLNVLIHGAAGSGKSWLAGAIVERLRERRYAVLVLDAEGDYRVLERLPGVAVVDVRSGGAMAEAVGRFERDAAACVVADLAGLPHARKVEMTDAALALVRALRSRRGLPHWVVLDEAHYALHASGVGERSAHLAQRGFLLVTYRAAWLRESAPDDVDLFVLARTTDAQELAWLRGQLAARGVASDAVVGALPDLPPGQFVLVGPAPETVLTFTATPRETPHTRHLGKYADTPLPPELGFLFRHPDGTVVAVADSLQAFRAALATCDAALVAHHAAGGDFSRWLLEVFADETLAAQVRKAEARWARGETADLRDVVAEAIGRRYALEP